MKICLFVLISTHMLVFQAEAHHPASADPATDFYEGYLIKTKEKDTLRGWIQLGSPVYGKKFVVLKQQGKGSPIDKLDIATIRLYYVDKQDSSRRYTDFKPLNFGGNVLWRLIGSGKADLYDDQLYPDTKRYYMGSSLGELSGVNIFNLVVVTKHERVRIPASAVNWGVPKKRNHFLLKFINDRYKTHFDKDNFADNGAMIRYIVTNG
jgi:hypothetical protein